MQKGKEETLIIVRDKSRVTFLKVLTSGEKRRARCICVCRVATANPRTTFFKVISRLIFFYVCNFDESIVRNEMLRWYEIKMLNNVRESERTVFFCLLRLDV